MSATTGIPQDPLLPGLAAIREAGLCRAIPELGIEDGMVEIELRAYKPGAHATLEVRTRDRHMAVKAYAGDPAPEAALHQAFSAAGLAGPFGVRVPPLLAWERRLRLLAVGWLEGPTGRELLTCGQGARAGRLAARWIQRAASLAIGLGKPLGATSVLRHSEKWVAALGAADPSLGTSAAALQATLARTRPDREVGRLVHGALHDRNLLDLGGTPGVIDWQRFGQGPAEVEAGLFLAAVTRIGLVYETQVDAAAEAEAVFLAEAGDLVDERALAWHRAAGLLRLADRQLTHRKEGWAARARALLGEAKRFACPA